MLTPHSLTSFWSLCAAPVKAQALDTALELDLFEHLATPTTAKTLSQQLSLDRAATTGLLDILWSLSLLERQPEITHESNVQQNPWIFQSSILALRYFRHGSSECCIEAWRYRQRMLQHFSTQWSDWVHQGINGLTSTAPAQGNWADAARQQIAQEQTAITVPAVNRWLSTQSWAPPQHFLDIGCGPGYIAMALAQYWPDAHGTLIDLPETLAVAAQHLAQTGLTDRFDLIPGQAEQTDWGKGYDVIWCASVLHFLDDPQALIQKAFSVLNPGGRLICAHAEITDDPQVTAEVLSFYSPMRARGRFIPTSGQIPHWMSTAGFQSLSQQVNVDFPMTPVVLHSGVKPCR